MTSEPLPNNGIDPYGKFSGGWTPELRRAAYLNCMHACWRQVPADFATFALEPMHWVPVHDWNSGFWECEMWFRVFYGAGDDRREYGVAMVRAWQEGKKFAYRLVFRSLWDDQVLLRRTAKLREQLELPDFMQGRGRELLEQYFAKVRAEDSA